MEKMLYWAIQLWIDDIVIPKSTDKACERMIQEHILEKEAKKQKRGKRNGNTGRKISK